VINLSPDKLKVFAEMFRILNPGGRVSVSDIVTSGELPEDVRNDMLAWGACIAGALEMDEYIQGLEQVGFEDVSLVAKTGDGELLEGIPQDSLFSASITARKPLSPEFN
jgi:ubiquinone/menaquinone biosynthesis C-methylase UbiE